MNRLRSFARPAIAAAAVGGLAAIVLAALPGSSGSAADHLDSPFIKKDGRIDINDVYVFHPSDGDSQDLDRTVLAMTVNPAAGAISGTTFRSGDASYELLIDTNGNAKPDKTIEFKFGKVRSDGKQKVEVNLYANGKTMLASGLTGDVISDGSVMAFAGVRDDPFFFDLANFNAGATFCGAGLPVSDFFLGLDVSALVIELPTEMVGEGAVGVWGRTLLSDYGQADRMGRPAINTVFIPKNPFETGDNLEDPFNVTKPRMDQELWRSEVVNSLTLLFSLNDATDPDTGDDAATVQALANVLLPDILTVDLSAETGFLNGRGLADDVVDAELGLITEGLLTSDCVDNDSSFIDTFPYLAEANG
jgi:hypothetical protein